METEFTNERTVENWVEQWLLELGILPNLWGFYQLKEAVVLTMRQVIPTFTRELYAEVAAKYNRKPSNIERNIRSAIFTSQKLGTLWKINSIIGIQVLDKHNTMSNSQLISLLANHAKRSLC